MELSSNTTDNAFPDAILFVVTELAVVVAMKSEILTLPREATSNVNAGAPPAPS
jgi:hypothetical protein